MKSFRALALAAGFALVVVSAARLLHPSGLRAQYFLGSEFAGSPVRSALDSTFSALQLSRRWDFRPPDAFSAQWSGYLFAGRSALYTFTIVADDESRLYVDQQPVIQEQGQGPGTRAGQLRLERGPHAILLQYVQLGGPYHLAWNWATDGSPATPVPGWALSTRPSSVAGVLFARGLVWLWWASAIACCVLGFVLVWKRVRERTRIPGAIELGSEPHSWRHAVACLALFVGLAMLQTWPLITNPAHLSRNDNADTVLNEWTMSWVVHQAARDPLHLFDANIFYPERHTLAYSESLIVQSAIGAPLAWLGASPVLVYNFVLLAGFALTGWATSLVVTRWTGDWLAGITSGILVAFNAHTLTRLPHIQAQHVEFLPLALLSLDSVLRRPRWRPALWLALWFTLQSLTSIHLLVFTAVAVVIAVAARPEDWLSDRFWPIAPKLAAAAALSGVALLPFLLPYWQLHREGLVRSIDEVAFFSATASDYVTTPSRLYNSLGASLRGGNALFPGVTALVLTSIALVAGAGYRDRRARMCLAFGLGGIVLSFGPFVPGYPQLYSILPLLQAIRAAARFGYLALFAVAVLSGYGLATVRRRLSARRSPQVIVTAAVLLLAVVEPFAAPLRYEPFTAIPTIYERPKAAANAVVVDLPFPAPDATYRSAPYVLGSTLHFKPLLNGYSGFTPPSYFAHYEQFRAFPDTASIKALQAAGVTHVFVHFDRLGAEGVRALGGVSELQQIETDGSIALYQFGTHFNR